MPKRQITLALSLAGLIFVGLRNVLPRPHETRAHSARLNRLADPTPSPSPVKKPLYNAADDTAMQAIQAHFNVGDYPTALKLADSEAEAAGHTEAFHAWLLRQMSPLLISAGWLRLKVGDCSGATALLRRAEALGRTIETTRGLAYCEYKQKDFGPAAAEFEAYFKFSPDDSGMHALYADLLESDGRYSEAVSELESAATQAKEADDAKVLQARLAGMHAKAQESQSQETLSSRNFSLSFRPDQTDSSLASQSLDILEDALEEYTEDYGFAPPQAPIEVILYSAASFRAAIPDGPSWAEGLFDGRLRIPIDDATAQPPLLARVLRHELVHALLALRADNRNLPSWFNEGLAQRLECTGRSRYQACTAFSYGPMPGKLLAVPQLEAPYTALDKTQASRAYDQSLFLVRTLESLGGNQALSAVVKGISAASDLSSEGLLAPTGTKFQTLWETASKTWGQSVTASP